MNQNRKSPNTVMWLAAVSLAALALTSLAGCGGGGGGIDPDALAGGARSGPIGSACAGAGCVSLGAAANYALLAKTGISTVPSSVVTGNVGLSPAARTFLTGWSLIGEPTDTYFTSAQVVGTGTLLRRRQCGRNDFGRSDHRGRRHADSPTPMPPVSRPESDRT